MAMHPSPCRVERLPRRRPVFLISATMSQETFEHYQRSTGFGAEARVAGALAKWGPNRFVVPLPSFGDMLKEQLVAPFFVFQVFCVGLWCLDDYW